MPVSLVRIGVMVFQLFLLALPAMAVMPWGVRRGWSRPAVFALGACTTAAAGYLGLWIYLSSPAAGTLFSWLLFTTSAVSALRVRRQIPQFGALVALWLGAAVLYYSLGFLYGGFDTPLEAAARRYFHWAADNQLPYVYAARVLNTQLDVDWWRTWNVYDRPPLATGLMLLTAPFGFFQVRYQTLGMLLQAFVLGGIWMFMEALGVPERCRRVTLGACVFSVFVLMNAFYVWPKLLPAGFLFLAAGLLFRREKVWLAGAAMGFSLLAHGGSLFPCLVLCAALPFWLGRQAWRVIAIAVAVYLPWGAYSAALSPTGQTLVHWHLGGTLPHGVTKGQSTLDVIVRGYGALSTADVLRNKWDNLRVQIAPRHGPLRDLKSWLDLILQSTLFVVAIPLATLAVCLAARLRRAAPRDPAPLVAGGLGLASLLLWCLMMFGPRMAVGEPGGASGIAILPQGSYWPPLCVLVALALLVSRCGRLPSLAMLLAQAAVFAFLGFQPPQQTGNSYQLSLTMASCAVVSGASLLLWSSRRTLQ